MLANCVVTHLLQFMTNIVNDAHFAVRDRMGRLLTFMVGAAPWCVQSQNLQ